MGWLHYHDDTYDTIYRVPVEDVKCVSTISTIDLSEADTENDLQLTFID
jgi:hypothetical protein